MLRFAEPTYLYLLFIIPILVCMWILYTRRKKMLLDKIFDRKLQNGLMPNLSKTRPVVKFILSMTVLALSSSRYKDK